jgi:hypothetical protein
LQIPGEYSSPDSHVIENNMVMQKDCQIILRYFMKTSIGSSLWREMRRKNGTMVHVKHIDKMNHTVYIKRSLIIHIFRGGRERRKQI